MALPGDVTDTTWAPGAARSGLATPWGAGPRDEKFGTASSVSGTVPASSMAPTVTTHGSSAGFEMVPAFGPWFPAATTTTIPEFHAFSTAKFRGSCCQDWVESVPSDRLRTVML